MNAAKKIILLLWLLIVANLGNVSASTPGASENRVWQKSFETLETRQAEPLQTLGGHHENGSAGYDYAVDSLLAAETAGESSMTTVLGSGRDVAAFAGKPGFNVLNMDAVPESEWARSNAEWLNAAVQRGDSIWLVTDPAAHTALMNSIGRTSYYLDLELPMLEEYGANVTFMWQ